MPKKDTTGAAPLPPQLKILFASIGALTETWRRWGHHIGFGIGIAHGFATLAIGFEGRFDYAAIGTVSNVASRLCDEAKPGQILISPRVAISVVCSSGQGEAEEKVLIGVGECVLRKMDGGALPIREWVAERVTEH